MTLAILFSLVIVLSAFCSCAEAAIATLDKREISRSEGKTFELFTKLDQSRANISHTIVVLNNIVNIFGTIMISNYVLSNYGKFWLDVSGIGLTLGIILFAEIIPKIIGYNNAPSICKYSAKIILTLVKFFTPANFILGKLTSRLTKERPSATEKDCIAIIDEAINDNTILESEAIMAKRALLLNDKTVSKVRTPWNVVKHFKADQKCKDIIEETTEHSRYLVVDNDIPTGIVYRRDILTNPDKSVTLIQRPLTIVNEDEKLNIVLEKMLDLKQHLFFVTNDLGDKLGVISQEDILEELLGREIVDESDTHEDLRELSKNKALELYNNKALAGANDCRKENNY